MMYLIVACRNANLNAPVLKYRVVSAKRSFREAVKDIQVGNMVIIPDINGNNDPIAIPITDVLYIEKEKFN